MTTGSRARKRDGWSIRSIVCRVFRLLSAVVCGYGECYFVSGNADVLDPFVLAAGSEYRAGNFRRCVDFKCESLSAHVQDGGFRIHA